MKTDHHMSAKTGGAFYPDRAATLPAESVVEIVHHAVLRWFAEHSVPAIDGQLAAAGYRQ